eukprot:scaffold648400_cov45-Prasinocladus_malaysianus.AAC.1
MVARAAQGCIQKGSQGLCPAGHRQERKPQHGRAPGLPERDMPLHGRRLPRHQNHGAWDPRPPLQWGRHHSA